MRQISNILFATALTAISYSAIAQPVQAISFNTTNTTPGSISPSTNGSTPSVTDFNFDVSGVTDPNNIYNYSLTINLTHTNLSNLEGYLIRNADNKTLNLFSTLSGANLTNTTFVDGSPTTIISNGSAPYTGSFAPEANSVAISPAKEVFSFSGFNNDSPNGSWTLRVSNYDTSTGSTLNSATLNVTPVPFESDASAIVVSAGTLFALYQGRKRLKSQKVLQVNKETTQVES